MSQEIKSFISGFDTVQGRKLSVREHARCAVRLLRSVPACRGAVLEHLRGVYDEHVSAFLHNLETEGDASSGVSSNLEDIIQSAESDAELTHSHPADCPEVSDEPCWKLWKVMTVLEHLRGVYDEHVSAYLHNLETEGDASSGVSSNLEDIIQEVHEFMRSSSG
ncbi:hypothetical protein Q8A73_010900 [Channa argus]|nr:hypothetical protein Q8A73_010900 [Channa argus]